MNYIGLPLSFIILAVQFQENKYKNNNSLYNLRKVQNLTICLYSINYLILIHYSETIINTNLHIL